MHRDLADLELRTERALARFIGPACYSQRTPLAVEAVELPDEPLPFAEVVNREFRPLAPGTAWGRPWGTTWLHVGGELPAQMAGRRVELLIELGFTDTQPGFQYEALAYRPDGTPVKGIHPRSRWLPIADVARPGQRFEYYIEAASNPALDEMVPTPNGDLRTASRQPLYLFRGVELAVRETEVWQLSLDVRVLLGLAQTLPKESQRRARILDGLCDMLDRLDVHDVAGGAARARHQLAELLASPADASAIEVSAVGHAHIDSAWLWPLREAKRKCARTFASALSLVEDYPDLVFVASQAAQYQWIKETQPALWQRLRAAVDAGNFVPTGGMWVESDTNMVGGEALVRQFTQGQRFFEREFGVTCQEMWLPDTFGYSGALPQIGRLAGARYFMSQKMSWSRPDVFPHSTFWWEGIDGTRIFTHFPPADTYNAELTAQELARCESNFKDRGPASQVLLPFGYGDGGGGPTREMLEIAHRLADLEGSPKVVLRGPAEFFERARADYPAAPVWAGEMYLEFHRGVFTSQLRTKQGNRVAEALLFQAELWCTQAAVLGVLAYPYEQLDAAWRDTLLLQFHDILPGSGIAWVYQDAAASYARIAAQLESLIGQAQRAIAGAGDQLVRFNAAPHARAGVPAFGSTVAAAPGVRSEATRGVRARRIGPVWVTTGEEDADTGTNQTTDRGTNQKADASIELANEYCRVLIGPDGNLTSVRVTNRELLAGPGNQLQLQSDTPVVFDAWDIDEFSRHQHVDLDEAESVELDETGDLPRVIVRRRCGMSRFTQTITLAPEAPRIDFTLDADWHGADQLLKAAFPLDIQARQSTAEVQFGYVRRPTDDNTSWQAAQFEVCAQRWLHLGEPGFGAAVLNQGGYGFDISRARTGDQRGAGPTTVRYSLLRAPQYPDPAADLGAQHIEYSLLVGDVADAVREGTAKGLPERTVRGGAGHAPLVSVDDPGVIISAIKLADDRSGDLIVRCYEALGRRARPTLTLDIPTTRVQVVNLLERPDPDVAALTRLDVQGNQVSITLTPFQIVTLRITRS